MGAAACLRPCCGRTSGVRGWSLAHGAGLEFRCQALFHTFTLLLEKVGASVSYSCPNGVPQTGRLQLQKCPVSARRPEVGSRCPQVGCFGRCQRSCCWRLAGSLAVSWFSEISLRLRMVSPGVCACVQISPFYRGTGHIGAGPLHSRMTSPEVGTSAANPLPNQVTF